MADFGDTAQNSRHEIRCRNLAANTKNRRSRRGTYTQAHMPSFTGQLVSRPLPVYWTREHARSHPPRHPQEVNPLVLSLSRMSIRGFYLCCHHTTPHHTSPR